jgi:glycosyltransferase involved in cell wall biosynthesis
MQSVHDTRDETGIVTHPSFCEKLLAELNSGIPEAAFMSSDSTRAVCIIVENEPVPFDRRTWQVARALRDGGYHVSVICPKAEGFESSREALEEIEIYRHPVWKSTGRLGYPLEYAFALVAEFFLAWKVFARQRFQILHACNPPDTTFLVALAFKPFGVRFVFDHHDLSPELYDSKYSQRGLLYRFVRLAERLSFRAADLSIATNESYKEIAITRGKMHPDRVVVVQTCADLGEVSGAKPIPGLKNGKKYVVLFAGVMEPQDGVRLLIESAEYLLKQKHHEDIQFVLVGSGSELPLLKAMAKRLGVADHIEFTGTVSHKEVCNYLCTADVCVSPDPLNPLNDKSTMIKVLEYMAFSRPIVMYDLMEGRRTAGDAALYARPDDPIDFAEKIEQLLESESIRRKLGERGRKRTEEGLNWQAQSLKLLDAYELVLQSNTHREPVKLSHSRKR